MTASGEYTSYQLDLPSGHPSVITAVPATLDMAMDRNRCMSCRWLGGAGFFNPSDLFVGLSRRGNV
jgi:hypothetical protein